MLNLKTSTIENYLRLLVVRHSVIQSFFPLLRIRMQNNIIHLIMKRDFVFDETQERKKIFVVCFCLIEIFPLVDESIKKKYHNRIQRFAPLSACKIDLAR